MFLQPCKKWDKLPFPQLVSAINSITWKVAGIAAWGTWNLPQELRAAKPTIQQQFADLKPGNPCDSHENPKNCPTKNHYVFKCWKLKPFSILFSWSSVCFGSIEDANSIESLSVTILPWQSNPDNQLRLVVYQESVFFFPAVWVGVVLIYPNCCGISDMNRMSQHNSTCLIILCNCNSWKLGPRFYEDTLQIHLLQCHLIKTSPLNTHTVCSVKVLLLQDFRICEMTFDHIHCLSCPIIISHGDSSPHRSVLWPGVNWLPSVTRRLNRCWRSEKKKHTMETENAGPLRQRDTAFESSF